MVQFEHFQESQVYTAMPAEGDVGFMAYFISTIPSVYLPVITINEAWSGQVGFFLFLKTEPADMPLFVQHITTYFNESHPDPAYTGFAWINYKNAPITTEEVVTVSTAIGSGIVALNADTSFSFGDYALPLRQFAPVKTVRESDNITGFTFEYPPYPDSPAPRQAYNTQLAMQGGKRGTLQGQVSLGQPSGNSTGFNASLYYIINYNNSPVAQHYPLFETGPESLQVLFNYSLDPVDALDIERTYLEFTGTSFFLKQNESGGWYIELNGQQQLPSYFRTVYGKKVSLIPVIKDGQGPKLIFEKLPPGSPEGTYYFAPSGDFELETEGSAEVEGTVTDFLLCGLSGAESFGFMSRSKTYRGDIMRFVARQNAYAPKFPLVSTVIPAQATPASAAHAVETFHRNRKAYEWAKSEKAGNTGFLQTNASLLTNAYTTSWINLRPNPLTTADVQAEAKTGTTGSDIPVYYSQPDDAALYDHSGVKVAVSAELLQLRNTAAAFFTAEVTAALAMVPYAGVAGSEAFSYQDIKEFEKQVIVAARRDAVSAIPKEEQATSRVLAEDYIVTTTPQGLLATVPATGLDWQSVLLAKSNAKGIDYSLEFADGITKELRDALQSNQLFLVATEAAPLGTFLNKITIEDWPFTINTGQGSSLSNLKNVLIFSFAGGSIESRVKDVNSWSNPGGFNENPVLVSNWISAYIETAKLNAQTDDKYNSFLNIVQSDTWTGVLALKVDIGVENFPDELKGLLAGIKRDAFYAHHFGIEVNFIQPDATGALTLPKSSMFGLINYIDKDYGTQQQIQEHLNGAPMISNVNEEPSPVRDSLSVKEFYDFTVLTLQVVFENSEIKDFASKIQLQTTAWFDEPAKLDMMNMGNSLMDQTIEFNGSYEKHNGVNTYTFVTKPDQTYKFLMESNTMNYVEIVKAQFYTITDQTPKSAFLDEGAMENITSRFIFWGFMNFKATEPFDLFSFGDNADEFYTNNKGLYFSNLYIDMDFMLDNVTGNATDRTFVFSPDRMSFDVSMSTPRDNSLFKNFPINLSGLIYSKNDDESKPSDLGYLPITIASIAGQSLTDKWYSLLYNLNLGSMGALAAKAGFVSQISTAWSPDTAVKRMATGIKLPGMGGQKTISLQSVLSLSIQSFSFTATKEAVTQNVAYSLKFNNVKLSLLGVKLPSGADTQFILFGDAEGKDKTTLAWYAAYFAQPKPPVIVPPPTGPFKIGN